MWRSRMKMKGKPYTSYKPAKIWNVRKRGQIEPQFADLHKKIAG